MGLGYRNFKFSFTDVAPLPNLISETMMKYATAGIDFRLERYGHNKRRFRPRFTYATSKRPNSAATQAMRELRAELKVLDRRPVREWVDQLISAFYPGPNAFTDAIILGCKLDASILHQPVRIPNIFEFTEWLVDTAIRDISVTETDKWRFFTSNLHFNPADPFFNSLCLDPKLPKVFYGYFLDHYGDIGKDIASFISKIITRENGFDVFGQMHGVKHFFICSDLKATAPSGHQRMEWAGTHTAVSAITNTSSRQPRCSG